MAIKRKRSQSRSQTSDGKTFDEKSQGIKLEPQDLILQNSSASSSSHSQYVNENSKPNNMNENNHTSSQATDSTCKNEFSQLKLMTIATGEVLRMRDSDDLWTRSRSLLRKNTGAKLLKTKSHSEYHRNTFHLSLKDKWSKVMTNKISALAFSRSLKGRRQHPRVVC